MSKDFRGAMTEHEYQVQVHVSYFTSNEFITTANKPIVTCNTPEIN